MIVKMDKILLIDMVVLFVRSAQTNCIFDNFVLRRIILTTDQHEIKNRVQRKHD